MTIKEELTAWLSQPDTIRVILVEVTGVQVGAMTGGGPGLPSTTTPILESMYLQSIPYSSTTMNYDPIISGGIQFTESISLDGSASVGFGDIEVDNTNGVRDMWLNYIWNKRQVQILIGDVRWGRDQFYKVFDGLVDTITTRDRNTLNLVIVDKLQRLNEPIQNRTLAEAEGILVPTPKQQLDTNKDKTAPIVLGEVFNIEGIQCSNSVPNTTLEYKVSDEPLYKVVEVRDNGVPVGFTENVGLGKFTLTQASYGQITCTVQGKAHTDQDYMLPYDMLIASSGVHQPIRLARYILTSLGDANSRFTWVDGQIGNAAELQDFDMPAYSAINAMEFGTVEGIGEQPSTTYVHADVRAGIYCTGGENKLDVIQKLLSSISVHLIVAGSGKLKFVKFALPTPSSAVSYTITDEDFEFASSSIQEISTPIDTVKLGFDKNYTPQEANLAAAIPAPHKALFKDEYVTVEKTQAIQGYNPYNISTTKPELQETCLIQKVFAEIEANNRLNIWKVPRKVLSITCYSHLLPIELGDFVRVQTNRFGFTDVKGTVISVDRNWIVGRVTLGVLI